MTRDEVIEALRLITPIQLMNLIEETTDPYTKFAATRFLEESNKRGYWFSELVEFNGDQGLSRMENHARVILKALSK